MLSKIVYLGSRKVVGAATDTSTEVLVISTYTKRGCIHIYTSWCTDTRNEFVSGPLVCACCDIKTMQHSCSGCHEA